MKIRLHLTADQSALVQPICTASASTISAGSIMGELRRLPCEQGGGLYLDLVLLTAGQADALREAYKKSALSKATPPKPINPQ